MTSRPRSHRQRGFSLIVVFLLIMVMVGLAAALMVTTQSDLQVAGQDRESATAFYASEAAIAFGKDWLSAVNIGNGQTAWSQLLASGDAHLCVPGTGARPGTLPNSATNPPVAFDAARSSFYQFCFHNNADDPRYFDVAPSGDTTDGDGALVIEGYGFQSQTGLPNPSAAAAHVMVQIAITSTGSAPGAYASDLSGATKRSSGEVGAIDTTQQSVR